MQNAAHKSQFHYGSIKTVFVIRLNNEKRYSLNSTMVRLKQYNNSPFIYFNNKSQFHYGSIKTNVVTIRSNYKYKSQFHYGSIKTVTLLDSAKQFNLVSIPLWFD